ncbi:kynureninase [Planococcus halotolerans]|uniref:Kynureninase n=2 Tax=Planococcus halotolerans TaxID=2233542 RepID=A0A365KNF3_9BACL|nr:kynureninase [Planococcus halotolerans]QHJ72473.1 kynureninase [Planococcus halotolerans]RAZ74687.1 kynureninase [Planococcus halotolerans]
MVTAKQLDELDPLKNFKDEFYMEEGQVYMDGNSLGLMSKRAEAKLMGLMDSWKSFGIDGWTEGENPWFTLAEEMSARIAPLVGAKANEVMVTGSITSNIHQMLSTLFQPTSEKSVILVDELNFPSDIYAVESHLRLRGLNPATAMRKVASRNGYTLETEDIVDQLTEDVAIVLLPSVLYRSGQLLAIREITEAAHAKGILVGFDLAHSIGAMPHTLHEDGVDFAVWCHYKYMNSGPGGTGGLYIHERHHQLLPGNAGWFGSDKAKQFDMDHQFSKAEGAGAYQIGTPNIFSMAPLLGSIEIFEEAGISRIREKSLQLTSLLREQLALNVPELADVTPRPDNERGGHIALSHPEAARICKALKDGGVVPDFRAPNIIRLAPVALYTSFEDVERTVETLKKIMAEELYKNYSNERNVVA